MIGVCEAFTLARKLGLTPQTLFDVVSKSTGQCWALTGYCPVPGPVPSSPANRDYAAGFTAAMMLKDLRLANRRQEQWRRRPRWVPPRRHSIRCLSMRARVASIFQPSIVLSPSQKLKFETKD